MASTDTIFALSSGKLPSGVAVIRVAGCRARHALETLAGPAPAPRRMAYRRLVGQDAVELDRGFVVWLPGPATVTGENMVEFHIHGSKAGVSALLGVLRGLEGLRPAEPGEFTRRAFTNGKIDLVSAEALADLIEAETEAQRRMALANADGRHKALYERWRASFIRVRAEVEAHLDFSDERDVPEDLPLWCWDMLEALGREIAAHLAGYHRAEIIRDGFDVVLLGPPNAGKSSLLNALAQRSVAIVSDEAGTTRDLLEIALDLGGLKVRVTDTAGIRTPAGKVEAIGIERALERAGQADLVLLIVDMTDPASLTAAPAHTPKLIVGTKHDLATGREETLSVDCFVSAKTGHGITDLVAALESRAMSAVGLDTETLPWKERHIGLLNDVDRAIGRCLAQRHSVDLVAEELRIATDRLGALTGVIHVEHILDQIFSSFCIGK